MSNAWYQVLSKLFGYLAAAAAVAVVLLALPVSALAAPGEVEK